MAYLEATKAALEMDGVIDAIVDAGIRLVNQREIYPDMYQFDVSGKGIPNEDVQVELWFTSRVDENGETEQYVSEIKVLDNAN